MLQATDPRFLIQRLLKSLGSYNEELRMGSKPSTVRAQRMIARVFDDFWKPTMARLINPVSFSAYFNVNPSAFVREGLVDPILNSDTRLFIDPLLLDKSNNEILSKKGIPKIKKRFEDIIRLLSASKSQGDAAWTGAFKLLNLSERKETCLGYGGASVSGSSRPAEIRHEILRNAKEIITLGENDPYIISLMGLFDDGVGPDTISDFVSNTIIDALCEITVKFCEKKNIKCHNFKFDSVYYGLPLNPFSQSAILFVPLDVVRDLPFAVDWSDVSQVIFEIKEIRDSVNKLIGGMTQVTVAERKDATKRAMLESLDVFRVTFDAIRTSSDKYDANADTLNLMAFRQIISSDLTPYKGKVAPPVSKTKEELIRIVNDIIGHFRQLVENNNLWEMLWIDDKPKRERAAQLLFFAISDVFCKANDVDISPETNSGGGPVDFKFSSGYKKRVIVEVKRSLGTVEHGYKQQLETYKNAADTDLAFFLIIDVGKMGGKLAKIKEWQKMKVSAGERTSVIEVVDAKRRKSASKT